MSECPEMVCPLCKENTGLPLSPTITLCHTCQSGLCISEDSLNLEKEDSYTGSSCSTQEPTLEDQRLPNSFKNPMWSFPGVLPLPSMSGKKKPASPIRNSSSENCPSSVTALLTGMLSEKPQLAEYLNQCRAMFTYAVTTNCEELARTTYDRLLWSELVQFFGVELVQGNRVRLGKKREWKLTLRIQDQNFGMATKITDMLSWMSFEEELISLTCSGGWIDIQSSWKLKEQAWCCQQHTFGSLQTSIRDSGIPK